MARTILNRCISSNNPSNKQCTISSTRCPDNTCSLIRRDTTTSNLSSPNTFRCRILNGTNLQMPEEDTKGAHNY